MKGIKGWWTHVTDAYPFIVEGIIGFGQVLITLALVCMQSIGIVIVLIMLAIVEIASLNAGLWFLNDRHMSFISAMVLVFYNMLIDTMIVNIEHEADYKPKLDTVVSLKVWWHSIVYFVGAGKSWVIREKSPAHVFYVQRRWITFGVFLIALSGRVKELIVTNSDVPISQGFVNFFLTATLEDAWVWTSGVTLTMISLIGVQRLTHYMAKQTIATRAEQKQKATNIKRRVTRQVTQVRASNTPMTTATKVIDRRATDATRGAQALTLSDTLDMLRRNIDVITTGKSARRICYELDIEVSALRTVQRALKEMRDNNEID